MAIRNPNLARLNLRRTGEVKTWFERSRLPGEGGGGVPLTGGGAAPEVAYWTGGTNLGGDPGLTVDTVGNGYVVADDGYVGVTNDVRVQFDSSSGFINAILDDDAGADEFRVLDSALAEVFSVDSNGEIDTALTAGYVVSSAGGVLSVTATATPAPHNILSASHGDTTPAAAVRGDVVTAQGAGALWTRLAISVPAATYMNYLGTANGDVEPAYKALFDANVPTTIVAGAAAATGAATVAARRDHTHGAPATYPATVHNVLDSTYHGDVLTGAITRGDVLYGNATPKIARLALGGITGSLVTRNATDVLWSVGALSFAGAFTLTVPADGTAVLGGGSGASPRVAYWTDANTLTSDAGLTVDAANDMFIVANDGGIGISNADEKLEFFTAGYAAFSGCNVGIGTTTPSQLLHLLSATSEKPELLIENTNNDDLEANITFYKNSGSPADDDRLGTVEFWGKDDGGTSTRFGLIRGRSLDISNGDEAGSIRLTVQMDGTERNMLDLKGYNGAVNEGEVIVNEAAQDVDFRVEAVGIADALEVRGSDGQITLGVLTAGYVNSSAGGVLSVTATATPTAHNFLSASHGDTTAAAAVLGDIVTAQAGPVWARLAIAVPAANVRNVLGVDNGDTVPAWKTALDATNPATLTATTAATPGTSLIFSHRDHVHPVTNTSDGDTTPSTLLSTDANGTLRVRRLGVGVAAIAANGTIALPDAGYVGNAAAAARLVFNSSGATDYAYFSDCYVGIGTNTPDEYLQVLGNIKASVATANTGDIGGKTLYSRDAWDNGPFIANIQIGADVDSQGLVFYTHPSNTAADPAEEAVRIENDGDVGIGITAPTAQLHIDQSSAVGAQPALYLDQGDVSEQHIVCSMNAADQDFPNILQLAVTGTPALWWDESEDSFGFKNVTGLLVEDADWIGNSGTTARLGFNSSGATDYAYFMGAAVGISTTTPTSTNTGLDIASGGIALVLGADITATTRTNLATKIASVGAYHYTNAQEPVTIAYAVMAAAENAVHYGGGVVSMNAATNLRFYTAANTTTVAGTERLRITDTEAQFTNISGITVEDGDYIGNSSATARLVFDSSGTDYANFAHGLLYVNETANTFMTQGLTINQGANDNELLCGKSSDVGQPFTSFSEDDDYVTLQKHSATAGGALFRGFRASGDDPGWAMVIQGYLGENVDDTKALDSGACVVIDGLITDGDTGIGDMNANGNIACFRTNRGGIRETVVIIDEDGDIYYDGALVPYDDYDDALAVRDARDVLAGRWNEALTYNAAALAKMGVISLDKDGNPAMVSTKRMTALMAGAIGQLYERVQQLENSKRN